MTVLMPLPASCRCLQVSNHRARGIFNKASNGVISNNVVQLTTAYGMLQTRLSFRFLPFPAFVSKKNINTLSCLVFLTSRLLSRPS